MARQAHHPEQRRRTISKFKGTNGEPALAATESSGHINLLLSAAWRGSRHNLRFRHAQLQVTLSTTLANIQRQQLDAVVRRLQFSKASRQM